VAAPSGYGKWPAGQQQGVKSIKFANSSARLADTAVTVTAVGKKSRGTHCAVESTPRQVRLQLYGQKYFMWWFGDLVISPLLSPCYDTYYALLMLCAVLKSHPAGTQCIDSLQHQTTATHADTASWVLPVP
jgi:hypothetical protein